MRWLRNREDAEDAVQDAVLSAFKHISSFEGRARMSSWVMSIVINSVKMQLRKAKRNVLPLDYVGEDSSLTVANTLPHPGPNPGADLSTFRDSWNLDAIHQTAFPDTTRVCATLRAWRSVSEGGSKTLGVPSGTVKAQLARGRGRLRKKPGKVLGAAGDCLSDLPTPNLSRKPGVPLRASSQLVSLWALANAEKQQEMTVTIQTVDVIPEDIGFAAMEVGVETPGFRRDFFTRAWGPNQLGTLPDIVSPARHCMNAWRRFSRRKQTRS